jgi:hypothetical protein
MALDLCLGMSIDSGGGVQFSPLSLAPVAWYDPSDISTLFQDSAGTTPVTASGQPVGKMLDKSGNGNHLLQATAASRPTYTVTSGLAYLAFDGVDDFMSVNAASLRFLGDLTLSAAAYKNAGSTYGDILSCLTNAGTINPYEFRFTNHATVLQPEFVAANGAAAETDTAVAGALGSFATSYVVSARRSIGATIELSTNKTRETLAHTMVPTSDASSAFAMGAESTGALPLAGRIYGALVKGSRLSDASLAALETWLGAKAGLVI